MKERWETVVVSLCCVPLEGVMILTLPSIIYSLCMLCCCCFFPCTCITLASTLTLLSVFVQGLEEALQTIMSEHEREASAIHDLVCTHFAQFISCKNTIVDIRR